MGVRAVTEGPPDPGAKTGGGQAKTVLLSTTCPHVALKHKHTSLWTSFSLGSVPRAWLKPEHLLLHVGSAPAQCRPLTTRGPHTTPVPLLCSHSLLSGLWSIIRLKELPKSFPSPPARSILPLCESSWELLAARRRKESSCDVRVLIPAPVDSSRVWTQNQFATSSCAPGDSAC